MNREELMMDILEAIGGRRSIRAFKPDAVPREVIERVLRAAAQCPSYMNTQPWEVIVVAGEELRELARKLYEKASSEAPRQPDIPYHTTLPPASLRRQQEHGARRLESLGIARDDEEARDKLMLENYRFFDAPCAVIIVMERELPLWSVFDAGAFVQTFMLAAFAEGLGTCAQATVPGYGDVIRESLGIPATKQIVLTTPVGYPDEEALANRYKSARADIAEFTTWRSVE